MKQYPKYKDSGIQWIGEIPEHWEVRKLKSVADFINRGNAPSYIDNGKIGVINQATFSSGKFDFSKIRYTEDCELDATRGKVFKDDVLLASTGGGVLGKTALVNFSGDYMADSHVTIIRDSKNSLNSKYLYLFLSVNYDLINGILAQGSTNQTELQRKWLEDFKIPFPNTVEQTAIASFLDHKTSEIDQLIAAKEELITKLEDRRKAIINEAVTGQAYKTGLIPIHDGKEVKFKDSGIEWLGEIPENWDIVKLKYIVNKIGSGVTPRGGSEVYTENGIPLLRSQNIHFDGLRLDSVARIPEAIHRKMNSTVVLPNDVLLNITGASIGRCFYVDNDLGEANVNQHVCIIRPDLNRISSVYLNFYIASQCGQFQILSGQDGTSREGLNFEQIKNFQITLPPMSDMTLISNWIQKRISNLNLIMNQTIQSIEKLNKYKHSLISEVVTGKIDVRDWQKE